MRRGAFNIDNLDMAKGVIAAAETLRVPVIIQTTYTTAGHAGVKALQGMINGLAEESTADIALHLDHGNSYDICAAAADAGYSSVMIDGSHLTFEENIALTRKVRDYAVSLGAGVEGELGRIGGTEDGITAEVLYTGVNECAEFVARTGIDFVAIGVGTAHGIYKGEPVLNIERIREIFSAVSVPLVLHGASGLKPSVVRECVKAGISKINFATEVRMAYTEGVREALQDPKLYDPKVYQLRGRERVIELVKEKIRMLII
jgi:tagatose 1,6-diphosphate aldolase GatY/KbaY